VRSIRIGIANALDHGKLTVFQQIGESAQGWMKTARIVDSQDTGLSNRQGRPILPIMFVGVRYNCVQTIVATCHLNDYQDRLPFGPGFYGGRLQEKLRRSSAQRNDRGRPNRTSQELSSRDVHR
jgi:hypothetical protein